MKASVIGLGIIGLEWAKHLESDGILVASWNRSKKSDAPKFESELESIPQNSEILHIVVADPGAVSGVLEKIEPKLSSKHIVIQSSTIDPASAQRFSALVRSRGALYLEAPFTGSLPAAQKRELVFYTGGERASLDAAKGYLERLSKKLFYIGTEKQAATLKLVMNLQIASALEALIEALSTARKAGISDETFFEAFKVNASYSGIATLKETKLRTQDYTPQFSIKHMAKDLRLLNRSVGHESLPILSRLLELYSRAEELGLSDLDISSLMKLR